MGFRTREQMMGTHEFLPGWGPAGMHTFGFRGAWGPERLRDWLNPLGERFLWQEFEGEMLVGELCDWTPCQGSLEMRYVGARRLRYVLDLAVEERVFRYIGDKVNIRPWNLPTSHTTCFGTLTELSTGQLVSRSVATFKLRHLPSLVGSVRPWFPGTEPGPR